MFNQILWALDNEIDGTKFEQLCTDLLGREGYIDIIPIGGNYDGGRDAEIRRFLGIKSTGGTVFFQYSAVGEAPPPFYSLQTHPAYSIKIYPQHLLTAAYY